MSTLFSQTAWLCLFSVLLSAASITYSNNARAVIRTVSNAPNGIAQFTTIASAITAASPGDTIYVMPTGVVYNATAVNKPVVLIGSGAWPESMGGQRTMVTSFDIVLSNSTCVIKGFDIVGSFGIWVGTSGSAVVEMNRFGGAVEPTGGASGIFNNFVFRNNLFAGQAFNLSGANSINGWLITNNVFNGHLGPIGWVSSGLNNFVNNVVRIGETTDNPLRLMRNTYIANNIIFGGGNFGTGDILNCQIVNNCFFGQYTEAGIVGSGSMASDNLIGPDVDPLFMESTNFNNSMFSYAPVAPFVDLHLQPGSPCIGSGTLGQDMGIYDGGFPWMDNPVANGQRTYYPGPRIPELTLLYSTGSAPPNSTLDVLIKGKNVN